MGAPKRKAGEVIEVAWGTEKALAYLVHGHVTYPEALQSLINMWGKTAFELDVDFDRHRHGWARWVQSERRLREVGIMRQIHFQTERGRGLFPVTILATTEATERWR